MYKAFGKTLFDTLVALVAVVLLAPLLLIVGILVFVDDGHPVLFLQRRVGYGGRPFNIFKFRTMKASPQDHSGKFNVGDSTRVTTIGAVLRRTKLDELPQFFNVLAGHMSLVGPRPEVQQWIAAYPDRWAKVLSVKPGITDNASLLYRHEETELRLSPDPVAHYKHHVLPRKLRLYEAYLEDISFETDLSILFRTCRRLLTSSSNLPRKLN